MSSDAAVIDTVLKSARELQIPGAPIEDIERVVASLGRLDLAQVPALRPLRVKVLGNITTDYLAQTLRLMLLRAGYGAAVASGHYGGLVRGLFGEADLTPATCDAAVLVLTHRDLQFAPPLGASAEQAREHVGREVEFWASIIQRSKVPTVILSFDQPPQRVLDEQEGLAPGGLGWHARMTNLELAAQLPSGAALVDAEALQYRVGGSQWFDDRLYHLCKQPFAMEALPEVAHTLVAALQGLLGRGRKVLVLDLDNTLWGGVVGDDGLQDIVLGPETAEGEAFVAFQSYAKRLSQRGIILAVCSKNRDEVARAPFREHTGMVLKEDDISCFVANFQDKASNLRHIAKTLNLGLDSLVFADDNPVERALVRAELPEVLVVDMPEDPAYYVRALEAAKAFPMRALTREDLGRVASYRAMSAVREASAASGTDMEKFLIGLEARAHVEAVDASSVDRIVQLIAKTNQFKLNLSVFQEGEVLGAAADVVALRLVDRLQDYGIVAIAVTRPQGEVLEIRNWVMSCRVFGRRLEHVMLQLLCAHAAANGCKQLSALHTPTEKNVILPDILKGLGFEPGLAPGAYHRGAQAQGIAPHHMDIVDARGGAGAQRQAPVTSSAARPKHEPEATQR